MRIIVIFNLSLFSFYKSTYFARQHVHHQAKPSQIISHSIVSALLPLLILSLSFFLSLSLTLSFSLSLSFFIVLKHPNVQRHIPVATMLITSCRMLATKSVTALPSFHGHKFSGILFSFVISQSSLPLPLLLCKINLTSERSQSCVLLYATSRHGIVFERKWPVFHARLARFLFLSLLSLAIVVSMSFAFDGDNFDDLIVSPTKK
ncbi:unnamed protein product [Acanthosepion pharaonis]|uniref:Transmembrane protein n=1 Tax=Acanthosepion pharaonis TaxID=158019 RepID=A0A812CDR7_ACAPH|nr:unnamed protein product [Sepia pharaonis]